MAMALPAANMSASEYLAWEREQPERHEYCDGEVFAMTGGSLRHSALSAAISGHLLLATRGSNCRVFSADQRVVVSSGARYVYPDVSLVCGVHQLAEGTTDVLANPCVVIEVLSPSTEAYDRGDKWAAYQQIPTLREYLLVSQTQARIEVFRRDQQRWQYESAVAGQGLTLVERFELEVDAIYEGIFGLPGG